MTESYPKPSSIGDDFGIIIQEDKMGVMMLRRRSYISNIIINWGYPATSSNKPTEEHSDGRPIACGTIAIDNSGQELLNRIANTTYERCRNGSLTLPAFPNFEPHIQALKNHAPVAENKTYKVTSQVHDRLVILEALASKWLGEESTSDEAKAMIDAHNKEYNPTGDMLSESRFGVWLKACGSHNKSTNLR
jgi:hypothetical protein